MLEFPSIGDQYLVFENGGYIYKKLDLKTDKFEKVKHYPARRFCYR